MNHLTTTTERKQRFANYSQFANNWMKENEMKFKTVMVQDGNYNDNFIYITRIGACGRPKFRVLIKGKDTVKNCLMLTFNTERHDKNYLEYFVKSKLPQMNRLAHGTCQHFLTQDICNQILAGVYSVPNAQQRELLY
jgi:hypothetical protein